jgi:poly-gamma-glutamate synthesis protein (capsule biosynthesis protein)
MSPENIGCLSAAKIDCCTLANNHVLDWGPVGLLDTLQALDNAQVRAVGAGKTAAKHPPGISNRCNEPLTEKVRNSELGSNS